MQYLILGGLFGFAGVMLWVSLRMAKSRGIAEERSRSEKLRSEVESELHQTQAERRDTPETVRRLDNGTF